MVTHLHFVPEAEKLNVVFAGFRNEFIFFQMIAVRFHHASTFQGRRAAIRDAERWLWQDMRATAPVVFVD